VGPFENVLTHLSSDAVALVSKILEVSLLAVLVLLYKRESAEDGAG
jgi:hypothetical protein